MANPDKESNPPPLENLPARQPDNSLTLKDYLETAAEASKRTRFITIVMVVASVLVLVSVLNSSDVGWITLRLKALSTTTKYAVKQFPLLCKCAGEEIKHNKLEGFCSELEQDTNVQNSFREINRIDEELARLNKDLTALGTQPQGGPGGGSEKGANNQEQGAALRADEIKAKREKKEGERQAVCNRERERLHDFNQMLLRTAAETKYTVRAPFFGVAFDINDVGLLGGLSLWIILLLLRLSLRSQIVSLRIGFKAARAVGRERWFYEILAGRQVFVFPYLEDKHQHASVAMGWTERLWRVSPTRRYYKKWRDRLRTLAGWERDDVLEYLERKERASGIERTEIKKVAEVSTGKVGDQGPAPKSGESAPANRDPWRVNRNTSLRVIPKLLCLLPFAIYAAQFWHDVRTEHYGNWLNVNRTWWLLRMDFLFLLNTLVFGLWCVSKWNELDKLWDYFNTRIDWEE